jgi:hypothetical protein
MCEFETRTNQLELFELTCNLIRLRTCLPARQGKPRVCTGMNAKITLRRMSRRGASRKIHLADNPDEYAEIIVPRNRKRFQGLNPGDSLHLSG